MKEKQNSAKKTESNKIPTRAENLQWLNENLPELDYDGIVQTEMKRLDQKNWLKKITIGLISIICLSLVYFFFLQPDNIPTFQTPYPYQQFIATSNDFKQLPALEAYAQGNYQTAQPLFQSLLATETNEYLQFLAATNDFYLGETTTTAAFFDRYAQNKDFLLTDACRFYQALLLLPEEPQQAISLLETLEKSRDKFVATQAKTMLDSLNN